MLKGWIATVEENGKVNVMSDGRCVQWCTVQVWKIMHSGANKDCELLT